MRSPLNMQDFYEDLFEELSKYGELENLNICDNLADHMVCPLFSHVLCCSDLLSSDRLSDVVPLSVGW